MGHEAYRTFTVTIYYNKDIVNKSIVKEELVFNEDSIDVITEHANSIEKVFRNEEFSYKGFRHSSEIKDNVYISTIVLDYDNMNMKELSDKDDQFTGAARIINENYKVSYEKLKKLYIELGFINEPN